jgi:histidine triad (HIT) family protein
MMPSDPACDFCAIAHGANQSVEVVAEDTTWVAFFPLDPATPGHTLVIPRAHIPNLWALDPMDSCDLMVAIIEVGRAIKTALSPEGMNLISSAGHSAEQTIFHLHLHLVPRWRRDGFGRIWPTEQRFRDADLEAVAAGIRSAFKST